MPSLTSISSCVALSILALASAAFASAFVADDPPPSAERILDRMDEACGDVQKRAALKSLRMKGTAMGTEFTEEYLGADRFKQTVLFGDQSFTMGTTGTQSWSTDPAMGITGSTGDAHLGVARWFAFGRRAPWRTLYEKAELLGVADVDGDDCWKLRMLPKAGDDATWYVDQASHLPLKIDVRVPDPAGGDQVALAWTFTDWKDVDGIVFPHVKTLTIMGNAMAYRYTSIEPNAAVSAEDVAPSKEVLEALANPKKVMQSGEVAIETVKAQSVVSIRTTVKAADLSKELARLYGEMMATSVTMNDMAGPPFTRYHTHGGDELDIEAGFPVNTKIEGAGRTAASELPAGKVAMTWHVGPYHDLQKTYAFLETWMKEHQLEAAGAPWEVYWTDPGMEPDPKKWRTQILWPIKG